MGKIYPVSTKYIIIAKIYVKGTIEKSDIVGAIFGQTEGLLGSELELREVQKSGRIGRINVEVKSSRGKTRGTIKIPSSMDKTETAIIAAAMETIDKIGPCKAKITIENIKDIRMNKREVIRKRAKLLLKNMVDTQIPDSTEITDDVNKAVRTMQIRKYGKEGLAAGPFINEEDEIILVEGRADVVTLLKYGFNNVISLNGANIPKTIKNLMKKKKCTLFVDGDRGGEIIIKDAKRVGELDFIAKAPDGKEVEELTKKEIHKALRNRIPAKSYKTKKVTRKKTTKKKKRISKEKKKKFKEMLEELIGTRGACLYDKNMKILGKVPISELVNTLKELDDIYAIVMDGTLNKAIVKTGEKKNVKYIVSNNVKAKSRKINIITSQEL